MTEKSVTSIGVLSSYGNSTSYVLLNNMLLNLGYEPIFNNSTMAILTNKKNFILLFEITPELVESIMKLNIEFDIILHTNLESKDYKKQGINKLIKSAKYIVINIDESQYFYLLKDNVTSIVISYGLNNKATVTASSLKLSEDIQFNICIQREILGLNNQIIEPMEHPIYTELIGSSKVYNIISSIICLMICDIKLEEIKDAFLNIKGLYRKLDKIWDRDFIVLDNYCSSLLDYRLAFEEVQNLKYNDLFIINGIDDEADIKTIQMNIETILDWKLALNIKKIFIYNGSKGKIKDEKINKILKCKNIEYNIYKDLSDCIFEGLNSLNKGDLLLILGGNSLNGARTFLPAN